MFACAVREQVFFLDLKRNRYLSAPLVELRGISRYVHQWPADLETDSVTGSPDRSEAALQATIAELSSRHLLLPTTESFRESRQIPHSRCQPADRTLPQHLSGYPHIRLGELLTFLKAGVIAKYRLSVCSLHSSVSRIVRRRTQRSTDPPADDLSELAHLVAVFRRLRPLLPPARAPCLLRSLSLLEFLAAYGYFPKLVFGVQAHPFSAHCWVQHADTLLNATLEDALTFTPIMVA